MTGEDLGETPSERSVLSIEQYAHVLAHLAHFKGRAVAEVLDRLGVSEALWSGAKAHWQAQLRAEFDDDEAPLAGRMGAALAAAKVDLNRKQPPLEDVPPLLAPPKVGAEFESVDETTLGVAALSLDAVPFSPSAGASPPPPVAGDAPNPDVGMTQLAVRALELPRKALPFAGEGEPPELTLTQYASFRAEMAHSPEREAAILPRYGIGNAQARAKLEAMWSDRFAKDPEEQRTFDGLVSAYVEWLRK